VISYMKIGKIKPLYLLNVILTIVLLTSLLANATTNRSETAVTKEYDPFRDMNADGKINILDLVILAGYFGTSGTPINTTALLLELQSRVNSLNASFIDLDAYVKARLDKLETLVSSMAVISQIVSSQTASLSFTPTSASHRVIIIASAWSMYYSTANDPETIQLKDGATILSEVSCCYENVPLTDERFTPGTPVWQGTLAAGVHTISLVAMYGTIMEPRIVVIEITP